MVIPIPRDYPVHAHWTDAKYRIHKVGTLWYLCDTVLPARPAELEEFLQVAQLERTHGWTRLITMEGRECTDIHLADHGFDTFEHAHHAYMSQIS